MCDLSDEGKCEDLMRCSSMLSVASRGPEVDPASPAAGLEVRSFWYGFPHILRRVGSGSRVPHLLSGVLERGDDGFGGSGDQMLGRGDPLDPNHLLVTSSCFRPSIVAVIRLAFACYTLTTLVFSLAWGAVVTHDNAQFFSFFTNLTLSGLCGYFWAAGLHTAVYARRGEKGYPLQRWPTPWRFLHLALLSTITVFPLLVSIVFWTVIADATTFDSRFNGWRAISVHLLNSVFALFEIFLTNTPPAAWLLLPFGILLLVGYVGIVYITAATQGFYAYPFMKPNGHPVQLALHILAVGLADTWSRALAAAPPTRARSRACPRRGHDGMDRPLAPTRWPAAQRS
ncbi:hypothetical protein GGX14DRAFT_408342 [Mycena pura]|uniref:Uncharacterized protein n=1 Tax=Mycena pura TaxID=153505 RepID=A0AAD6ULG3_9AGAR|nr:hypothetical protein GGX14DRAFT_408342 [Mycena pura]